MKALNKITIAMVLALGCSTIKAQQVPMYTHYMNNTLVVNPAYAGSRDALTVTALHRSQWVGFSGAPSTQTLTLHAPLKNEHIGLGLAVSNDKIGVTNNTGITADFAYIMKINDKSKFALGLDAGINLFKGDYKSVAIDNPSDPMFQNDISSKINPVVGFGAYYYRERFYAGLSAPNLLENKYSSVSLMDSLGASKSSLSKEERHFFFIIGTMINITDNLGFKPTALFKFTPKAPAQTDITASFVIMKKLLLGVMYRTDDAVGGLIGFDITEQFHVGYSYDWSFGLNTPKYNSGSHEIILRYDFSLFDKKQVHTPRHF